MRHAFFLAVHSLWWNRGRSLTIILSLAITIWLPVTVRLALRQFQQEISARAASTPLIVGARGSRIDLVLHALYFESVPPAEVSMKDLEQTTESGLAIGIPLHIRYRSQSAPGLDGAPIVGTSLEYFEFRGLRPAEGALPALLGECVVGSEYARLAGLKVGDSVLSAPRNALNLAGDYPLKMQITGILEPTQSPDDKAIFTDVQTAWVIDGIGHGHQEVSKNTDPALLLQREDENGNRKDSKTFTANAGVLPFTEITDANRDSFHFHGEPGDFPLTAIIVVPETEKARVQILGRFQSSDSEAQCIKPPDVIDELMSMVFRIEQLVWACSVAALVVTLLLLGLVLNLSLRLRAAEMQTMFRLGCSRGTIWMLQTAEILVLLACASLLALTGSWLTVTLGSDAIRTLLY
ncbi:MAG: hypothetical protein JNM43_15750 [Planctomycetaceae bacterium]|nr:hypothetical protein [Planctomycetaceae bacterium]